jgi:serine protease
MKKTIYSLLLGLSTISLSVNAASEMPDTGKLLIDGSYIVTFKDYAPGQAGLINHPVAKQLAAEFRAVPKFGEHGTGQSKDALAASLGLRGKVESIMENINAAHIKMGASEAARLRQHPGVLRVEQNKVMTAAVNIQGNPGWGLDRLDQTSTTLNQQYQYNANGAGQTVYVLDSGLDLSNSTVAAQFGGRASVIWDVNGGNGADCNGHGTQVASAIGSSTYGAAKGTTLVIAKITQGCTINSDIATMVTAFNWLAANAPSGTIVNMSYGIELKNGAGQRVCGNNTTVSQGISVSQALEDAITAAYNKGVIVVVSAGNDGNIGCNTAYYSPTRQSQAFVVGATDDSRLSQGKDAKAIFSRTGTNISTFAPGTRVNLLNFNGQQVLNSGTSFSAPYIAGIFAAGCQYFAPYCSQNSAGSIYQALRDFGVIGTVVNPDGSPLTGATSRFISRSVW